MLQQLKGQLEVMPRYFADNQSEIDFVLQYGATVIPAEVKGGEDKSAPSFKAYIKNRQPEIALRFSKMSYRQDGAIRNIPLYLAVKQRSCCNEARCFMLVLYFSGTGNSKYIATQFALKMDADYYSIEDTADFAELLAATDTVAVCYPIYGSCVPRIMREFAAKYNAALSTKKLIIFCTQMMFSGDGAHAFARLLPGCDSHVLYAEHFNMPNNISNFWLFPIRDGERIRKKHAANRKLNQTCRDIQGGIVKRRGWNGFCTLLGKLQNTYWLDIEEKQRGSFVADSDCNRCGLCVRRCPVGNLELSEQGVLQKNNCILCYRCVNLCPQKAATVILHAKPKRQYKGIVPERETTK